MPFILFDNFLFDNFFGRADIVLAGASSVQPPTSVHSFPAMPESGLGLLRSGIGRWEDPQPRAAKLRNVTTERKILHRQDGFRTKGYS